MFHPRFRFGLLPAALLLSLSLSAFASGEDARVRRALEDADVRDVSLLDLVVTPWTSGR